MVKIYCGEQCTDIEAAKLRAMTAKEAVAAASKLGDKSASKWDEIGGLFLLQFPRAFNLNYSR